MNRSFLKIQKQRSNKFVNSFFKNIGLDELVFESSKKQTDIKLQKKSETIKPVLEELYFLYQMIKINNRLTVLEFGSGYSTLIMSIALYENKLKLINNLNNIRKSNIFEIFTIENEIKYLNITKKRNNFFLKKLKIKPKINYIFSNCNVELFNGNIVHSYSKLPKCNPDLIYLDGPGQFNLRGNINNINFAHNDFTPISSDIIKIEFFLNPGTIIVIDGRYHNVVYLRSNLKRNWIYHYVKYVNKHVLFLVEKPTGIMSKNLLSFYKKRFKNV